MQHLWLAGLPVLLERHSDDDPLGDFQASPARGLVLALHGLYSDKETFSQSGLGRLSQHGYDVLFMDAAWHGERRLPDVGAYVLQNGERDYLWGAVWETALGMKALLDALEREGYGPFYVVGHSMGGHLAHWLMVHEPRLKGGVVLSGSSAWNPDEVKNPRIREWVRQNSPLAQAAGVQPRPLRLVHGLDDDTVSPERAREAHAALLPAYQTAGVPDLLNLELVPGEGHLLSEALLERVLSFFEGDLALPQAIQVGQSA